MKAGRPIVTIPDAAVFVRRNSKILMLVALSAGGSLGAVIAAAAPPVERGFDAEISHYAQSMLDEGRRTFRYDTFGSESFWGDTLQLHKAVAGEKNGGIGPGVSPKTALSVGLKVEADALPDALKRQLAAGKVDPHRRRCPIDEWAAVSSPEDREGYLYPADFDRRARRRSVLVGCASTRAFFLPSRRPTLVRDRSRRAARR